MALRELQRQDAHSDEVGAVDALVTLSDNRLDTEQLGAFGSPVTRGTRTVLLTTQDDQRDALLAVIHRGVIHRRDRPVSLGEITGEATLSSWGKLIAQSDISEGATHHDLVIPTPGTIGVEVAALDAIASQPLAGRGIRLNVARRGNVVSGDRVTQLEQHASAGDVTNRLRLSLHTVKDR